MVVLNFPEKATFKSLRSKLLLNERSFRRQQLNQPTSTDEDSTFKCSFDEDILRKHLRPATEIPQHGDIFIAWDWASTTAKHSDFSAGVAAKLYRKDKEDPYSPMCLGVIDIRWGKYKHTELAWHIVDLTKKWNPVRTMVEDSNGAELLKGYIVEQARRSGTSLNIYWQKPSNEVDAKRNRIKSLETLLVEDRLWFFGGGAWVDETFSQLMRYTGEKKNRGKKDDIPDAMSYLATLPLFSLDNVSSADRQKQQEADMAVALRNAMYARIFDPGGHNHLPQSAPTDTFVSQDPRNRIFGDTGLHI